MKRIITALVGTAAIVFSGLNYHHNRRDKMIQHIIAAAAEESKQQLAEQTMDDIRENHQINRPGRKQSQADFNRLLERYSTVAVIATSWPPASIRILPLPGSRRQPLLLPAETTHRVDNQLDSNTASP